MVYTIIWLTLFTVWTGALLAMPVLQARELKGAKAANPDVFVAFSYPPDTFALAEQA